MPCSLGLVGLGLVLEIGLLLGLAMVLGLAHFTFCHTSSPQNPASPHARILPIASCLSADTVMPLTNVSLKLRKQRRRSLCFAQSAHHIRTTLLSKISGSNVFSKHWKVLLRNFVIVYICRRKQRIPSS